MNLNKQHPSFDIMGEMLALLPPFPHYTKALTVASDLGLTQREVFVLASRATSAGMPVRINQHGTARVMRMDRHVVEKTQEWAERYFNTVYPDGTMN